MSGVVVTYDDGSIGGKLRSEWWASPNDGSIVSGGPVVGPFFSRVDLVRASPSRSAALELGPALSFPPWLDFTNGFRFPLPMLRPAPRAALRRSERASSVASSRETAAWQGSMSFRADTASSGVWVMSWSGHRAPLELGGLCPSYQLFAKIRHSKFPIGGQLGGSGARAHFRRLLIGGRSSRRTVVSSSPVKGPASLP